MSKSFSQAKLKGEERRAILQAIETQMQQVIIDGVTQVLQEFMDSYCIWPARVAGRKGHSFLGYFILSLFFFPLAVIMAYVVQDRSIQQAPPVSTTV